MYLVRIAKSRALKTPVVRFQHISWKPWYLCSQSSRSQLSADQQCQLRLLPGGDQLGPTLDECKAGKHFPVGSSTHGWVVEVPHPTWRGHGVCMRNLQKAYLFVAMSSKPLCMLYA